MRELKNYVSKLLFRKKKPSLSKEDIQYIEKLQKIVGYQVRNPQFFREAFSLKFPTKHNPRPNKRNYERLEFLGDAILGAVISDYIFQQYPKATEGYMTQLKAKIVNRKILNKLGEEIGLHQFLGNNKNALGENTIGNVFEALIGAIFLDTHYEFCRKIILERFITPQKISQLDKQVGSYKSLLLEWCQREKKSLSYDTSTETQEGRVLCFRSVVWVDDEKISNETETSKKKAEEKAAQKAFRMLAGK